MGSDSIARAFRRAANDDDVRAIIFRVDSPGGSYVASDVIWREVRQARKRGKSVIVSMGNVAGSGGYFIAAPADRIIAQPATLTGSIGVAAGKMVTRRAFGTSSGCPGIRWPAIPTPRSGAPSRTMTRTSGKRLERLLDVVLRRLRVQGRPGPETAPGRGDGRGQGKGLDRRRRQGTRTGGRVGRLHRLHSGPSAKPPESKPDTAIRLRLFPRRKSTLRLLAEGLTGYGDGEIGLPVPDLLSEAVGRFGRLANRAHSREFDAHRSLLEMRLPARLR